MTADDGANSAPNPGAHSRNMMTALIGNGYPALIAFFTGPILAQALGVDGRGAVAAASGPFALVTTIATFGVPEAVSYAVARHGHLARAAAGRGVLLLLGAGLLATLAVILAAPFLSGGKPAVAQLIFIASIAIVPTLLVGILRGVASAQARWRLVSLERIISATLRLLVLVPFWLTHSLTPLIAVISVAAVPVLGGLAYVRVLGRRSREPVVVVDEARLLGLASYGSRIWLGSLSGILLSRLDQTLMTPLSGTYQLGLYVVAVSISELPLIVNAAVRDVTFVSDATESVDSRLSASARISAFVCLIAGVVIGVSMMWLLPLLFGASFTGAIPVTAILLAAVILGTPGSIAGAGLSGRGRPGLRSASLIIASAVNIVLLIVLTPPFGAIGAALSTLVGNLLASNLNLFFLWRNFGIGPGQFYGIRRSDLQTVWRFGMRILRAITRRG